MDNKVDRMKNLVEELNHASSLYYNGISEISDQEFDLKLEQLKQLEKETMTVLSNSPSINVGAEVVSELPKVTHTVPMLSLDKVHQVEEIIKFANNKETVVSIKLDGLSTRAIYQDGKLIDLCSRGNGVIGTRTYVHRKSYTNLPLHINKKGTYIIDGETIITYKDFEEINSKLPNDAKFSNPRNTASGSLALLDPKESKKRKLTFVAWNVIEGDESNLLSERLNNAKQLGFTVVPYWLNKVESAGYVKENLSSNLDYVKQYAEELGYPCDGACIHFNDIAYGHNLGRTEKSFNNGIAYKYEDESYPTKLRYVEYTMGKTGVLTPVCHFDPVQFPDSVVEKASLHNLSVMKALGVTNHCTLNVVKFNMIIPGVISCEDDGDGEIEIIDTCSICGGKTEIRKDNDSEILVCTNPNCKGKLLGKLTHAVSRNCLNIDGLSEATIETLINRGWLTNIKDIYNLSTYKTEMTSLPGFGAKSVNKLLEAIEKSRNTTLDRFLYSLSIPLLGKTASKVISKFCESNIEVFIELMATPIVFLKIDGIGDSLIGNLENWWDENRDDFMELIKEFEFETGNETIVNVSNSLSELVFVITGKLVHYKSRSLLESDITSRGGKLAGSVSKNTSYLINNDTESSSSKNKKAKELGVPIISEEDFLKMINQ